MGNTSNLGIENNIDGIKTKELLNNETALKMLLHNHKKLEGENTMLKQDLQRQSTIQRALDEQENQAKIAGVFSLFSSALLGFGINFVTGNTLDLKGWVLVAIGIVCQIASLYYSFRKVGK